MTFLASMIGFAEHLSFYSSSNIMLIFGAVLNFTRIEEKYISEMFLVAQKILKAIEKSDVKCEGANIFLSDAPIAGQEVMHSHLHIAPRYTGDGHRMGFSESMATEFPDRNTLNQVANKIKSHLV